jgi:hypothetical protein
MDNEQNFDSYINMPSSQTYRSWFHVMFEHTTSDYALKYSWKYVVYKGFIAVYAVT